MRRKYRVPALLAVVLCAVALLIVLRQSSPVGYWSMGENYIDIRSDNSYEARFSGDIPVKGSWYLVGSQLVFTPSPYGIHETLSVRWEKDRGGLVLYKADRPEPLLFTSR